MISVTSSEAPKKKITYGLIAVILMAAAAILAVTVIHGPGEDASVTGGSSGSSAPVQVPAVSGAATESPEPPALWLQASGSSTGNPAWSQAVRAPFDTLWILETGAEIFSPPAIVGDFIYMAGNDTHLRCLNRFTGEQMWSRTVTCGVSGGVAADSQLVFFSGQDGYLYALNRGTGAEEWKAGLGYHVFTDAAVLADTMVLAGNSMGSVAALSASDGGVVWSHEMNGLVTGPAVSDSIAVFTTESGEVAAFLPEGERIWSRSFSSQPSPPSISGGAVYLGFSTGKLFSLSLHTGETIWETELDGVSGRAVVTRPAVFSDSLVVAGTCDRRVVCLKAADGAVLWDTSMENWVAVTPAVCDTIVYASCDDGRIHLLHLNDGAPLDTLETGTYSGTPPVLIDGVLYAGNADGDILALAGTAGTDSSTVETEPACPAE